jgi:hypothetical protein
MTRIFDEWQSHQDREQLCSELLEKYGLYARKLFSNYEPLVVAAYKSAPRDFFQRLDRWLQNFSQDDDRWEAFQLIDDIFYVGRHELIELYRTAFEMVVPNWLCSLRGISLRASDYDDRLQEEIDATWFCPITDSLRISAFRHINHIKEPDYFPDWRSLQRFGNEKAVQDYIKEQKFRQIVLVEDFVGSGRQISPAVRMAERICGIPVLVVPLVIGSRGHKKISGIAQKSNGKIHFQPVIVLGEDCAVTRVPPKGREHISSIRARKVISSYTAATNDKAGYGFEVSQGYLFVAETNCPNNTIRPIHAEQNWKPLFPRSGRRSKK